MDFKRFSAAPLIIMFALAISPGWARASDVADVTAAVHRYVDNLGDKTEQIALAMCDSYVLILDEFPRTSGMARRPARNGGMPWVLTTTKTGLPTETPSWARPGPSTSAEIAPTLWRP